MFMTVLLSIFFYYMFYMYCMQKSNFFILYFASKRPDLTVIF